MKLNFLISKLFKLSIGRISDLHNFYDRLAKKHFLSQFFNDSAYDCVKFLIEKDEKLREEIELLLEDLKNNEVK